MYFFEFSNILEYIFKMHILEYILNLYCRLSCSQRNIQMHTIAKKIIKQGEIKTHRFMIEVLSQNTHLLYQTSEPQSLRPDYVCPQFTKSTQMSIFVQNEIKTFNKKLKHFDEKKADELYLSSDGSLCEYKSLYKRAIEQ